MSLVWSANRGQMEGILRQWGWKGGEYIVTLQEEGYIAARGRHRRVYCDGGWKGGESITAKRVY